MKAPINLFFILSLIISVPAFSQIFTNVAPSHGITRGCGVCGVGSGISFVDFNQDGWDDLTFGTQAGDELVFYTNNNGSFQEIPALVSDIGLNKQVLWVDYDKDGDKDLFVANFESPSRLYNNTGNLAMVDVTAAAGLPLTSATTTAASFGDIDNDGWLDLYVANWDYQDVHTNFLYKNNGDGTFTDITTSSGTSGGFTPTLAVAFVDYNNDSWADLYVSEDRYDFPNILYKNNGDGTFTDVSVASGSNISIDAMNAGCGDYDNDGDLDIYVTNTPLGNKMLRNEGNETFTEVASQLGVEYFHVGWGGSFFDFDNDKDLDLYMSGMHVGASNPSVLYVNRVNIAGVFNTYLVPGDTLNSFANAIADFDGDGKLDIAVNNATPLGQAENDFHLWKNNYPPRFHWLKIDLVGVQSNIEGTGSWLEMYLGANKYVRYTHSGAEYLGQSSNTIQFGTGFSTLVDSLIIKWPSGVTDRLYDISVDQKIQVVEGSTVPSPDPISFKEVAESMGIIAGYGPGGSFGGGISFADFNDDGLDDLTFASQEGDHIFFFVNTGSGFSDQNTPVISNTSGTKQVVWVDYDNDGDKDFFVTAENNPNRMYRNDGYPNFTDVTESIGLPTQVRYTYGAVFGDVDKDWSTPPSLGQV